MAKDGCVFEEAVEVTPRGMKKNGGIEIRSRRFVFVAASVACVNWRGGSLYSELTSHASRLHSCVACGSLWFLEGLKSAVSVGVCGFCVYSRLDSETCMQRIDTAETEESTATANTSDTTEIRDTTETTDSHRQHKS